MCDCESKNYALLQGAEYNPKTNQILYGTSNQIGSIGVSDGKTNSHCNVFDENVYKKPCSAFLGTAGGNPCQNKKQIIKKKMKTNENFETENKNKNSYNITTIINIVLFFLLFYLFYNISNN